MFEDDPDPVCPEMPMAFEADGTPVPVAEPTVYDGPAEAGDGLDLEPVLDLFLLAARDARQVGERVVFLSYLMPQVAGGPKSLRELATWLGCSHVAARVRLNRFKADFASELSPRLNRPRIGERQN
jgi:hypothetical protein